MQALKWPNSSQQQLTFDSDLIKYYHQHHYEMDYFDYMAGGSGCQDGDVLFVVIDAQPQVLRMQWKYGITVQYGGIVRFDLDRWRREALRGVLDIANVRFARCCWRRV